MIETAAMAPPDLNVAPPLSKFKREQAAFARLKPQLLSQYRGQFVAIHDEQVVASGSDHREVAFEAYRKYGYVPIYVDLVADEIPQPVRMPSFRVAQG